MVDFIYPPRNLPGTAEVWGRAVETRDNLFQGEILAQGQKMDNALRATGGQLSVVSAQIDTLVSQQATLLNQQSEIVAQQNELLARRTYQVSPPDFSVTGVGYPAPYPSNAQSFALPGPTGGPRTALLSFVCSLAENPLGANKTMYIELRQDGSIIGAGQVVTSIPTSSPPGWTQTFSVTTPVTVPSGGSVFQLSMTLTAFSTGTSATITALNQNALIQYGALA